MDIRRLTDGLSVTPQISTGDIAAIKAAGFRAVVCNRPDGEEADQPSFAEIADAAAAEGLQALHLPVVSGKVTDEDATKFADALDALPGPVLAYCRTGTRSAMLWSLTEASRRPVADILDTAGAAGYDLSGIAGRLADAAGHGA